MRNITPAYAAMSKFLRGHFVRVRKFSFRFCDAVRRKQIPSHRCPFLIDHAKYDADFFEATSINFIAGLTVEPEQNTHDNFLYNTSFMPPYALEVMRFALGIYARIPRMTPELT